MQILKRTGIDWRERRLISKLYMDHRVKVRLDRGETRSVQIGRGVRQRCCLSPILFKLYSECLTKEPLDGLGDFNIGGKIIQTVKYADALVLIAKEQTVLQGMIDKLIEIGSCYGMEIVGTPTCQRIFLYSALLHNPSLSLSLFASQVALFRAPTSGSH